MLTRRRFLSITAAALAAPAANASTTETWQGVAMGSRASITLVGATRHRARRVFRRVEARLQRIEAMFSLHRDSALTRLNRDGRLSHPAPEMLALFDLAGRVHAATGGRFDPSVQPLWLARATGGDTDAARRLIGWQNVTATPTEIRLHVPGMALTFNGIAQGEAADQIAALMRDEGFGNVMIDMGEVMALGQRPGGGDWRGAVAMPDGREVVRTGLSDRALATSSPFGTRIGKDGQGAHILAPDGRPPVWQLVSVSADRAALADALSTAFCLMDRASIDTALQAFAATRLIAIA